ncbi:hypothetical protein PsorP6_010049 [Peronosclerospora sorghi]|uniref:Uncharacterized protein n=1 Tax=Peronosclerospora sorghi TaxID=230839 RepID=A0ACC0VV80_9STRA|nr:hypothetical protein PsorP6_010049 [Peronosclerospora sorghi]
MTSNNNETLGQTKQRHKMELRTLQNEVNAFQKKAKKDRLNKKEFEAQVEAIVNALKERHNQELKAFEREEENKTSLVSHTNEAAEAASLATKTSQGSSESSAQERKQKKSRKENNENASMKLTRTQ